MNKKLLRDMVHYGFVSVFALFVDFGSLLILNSIFHVNYLIASTVAFLLGTIANFALSNGRIFKNPIIKNRAGNFIAFTVVGLAGLVANDIIIWLCHSQFGFNVPLSKCVSVVIVFFWNFLARRQFLYNKEGDDK